MHRIAVELEAVTATLVHVEPGGEPRWRAAPFRGLMRWWFRAIVGAALPARDLRTREEAVFGTAERASPVIVRVFPVGAARPVETEINAGGARPGRTMGLPAGSRVRVELLPAPSQDRSMLNEAYGALWAAVHFGGVGLRTRRGAGSLRMISLDGIDGPGMVVPGPPDAYASALAQGLRRVRGLLRAPADLRLAASSYPTLHPASCTVTVAHVPAWTPQAGGDASLPIRRQIMALRRNGPWHQSHRAEPEFGGVQPRMASPLWVRVADAGPAGSLLVASVFRHAGAKGANWPRVDAMLATLPSRVSVAL